MMDRAQELQLSWPATPRISYSSYLAPAPRPMIHPDRDPYTQQALEV